MGNGAHTHAHACTHTCARMKLCCQSKEQDCMLATCKHLSMLSSQHLQPIYRYLFPYCLSHIRVCLLGMCALQTSHVAISICNKVEKYPLTVASTCISPLHAKILTLTVAKPNNLLTAIKFNTSNKKGSTST